VAVLTDACVLVLVWRLVEKLVSFCLFGGQFRFLVSAQPDVDLVHRLPAGTGMQNNNKCSTLGLIKS
jgi:hypothetical protein